MHDKVLGASLPSTQALAYLGDAAYSLFVRRMLVEKGLSKAKDLNRETLKYVTAEAQANMYRKIEHLLLEDEREVFKRAANSTHLNRPKHASVTDYRYATGFEAVIGMLVYIKDDERIEELLSVAHKEISENDTEN
ncbi:MAG: Mini-ribonuclease 3 [Clostridia bacterium]|nr:Mini-ribonuclease 3 [Clostridia bacterium]